jgi:hypothetical protein
MSSASSGSSQGYSSSTAGSANANQGPLIPVEYCDTVNQRWYAVSQSSTFVVLAAADLPYVLQVSLFALQQSYKAWQFMESYIITDNNTSITSGSASSRSLLLLKWTVYDIITLYFILPRLRIPRLSFIETRVRLALVAALLFINWLCIGDWKLINALGLLTFFLPTSWRGTCTRLAHLF